MVGKIYDDHGPSLLLLFGTFLHVFGLMLTSTGTTYVQIILSQSICSGIGASMVFYPAVNCVSSTLALIFKMPLTDNALLGVDLVPSKARGCTWTRRCGCFSRWCHLPHHGDPAHSVSRLRLGHAHLRLPHPRIANLRQLLSVLASPT
jgi:hypothetical protein